MGIYFFGPAHHFCGTYEYEFHYAENHVDCFCHIHASNFSHIQASNYNSHYQLLIDFFLEHLWKYNPPSFWLPIL